MRKLTFLLMPFCVSFFIANDLVAQTLMQIDSSLFIRDTLKPLAKRFENIRISGYMQPQYQTIASTGAATYAGGDFQENSNSRFMLRRGRLRVDYLSLTREGYPKLYFAFQFDGTERGVNIRDFWGKFYENKWSVFSITTGVFGRPFGFEVDYSSTVREAPERGRMSQILLQTERDIGVMLRFEPQRRDHRLKWLSVDAGLFNGQGLPGRADFDSKKDFITRVSVGPFEKNQLTFNGSVSSYLGGIRQFTKYKWTEGVNAGGDNAFLVDSSLSNIGKIAKRNYFSADGQLKIKSGWGVTEFRAEYWRGTTPGTQYNSAPPPSATEANAPLFQRNFDGAFFYFLQNIVNTKHQIVFKYDWYDPNKHVSGEEIGKLNTNFTAADMRYNTLGMGYLYYFNNNLKMTLWYDIVRNEKTSLDGYENDLKDNVFTCRLQFHF